MLAPSEIGVRVPADPLRQDSSAVERRSEEAGAGGSNPPPDTRRSRSSGGESTCLRSRRPCVRAAPGTPRAAWLAYAGVLKLADKRRSDRRGFAARAGSSPAPGTELP